MKIRYYQDMHGRWRLAGFLLAMVSVFILSDARWFFNPTIQSVGWGAAAISGSIWVYIAAFDKDLSRTGMEDLYFCMAARGVINWMG